MGDDESGESQFYCHECQSTIYTNRKTGKTRGHKSSCTAYEG